MLPLLDRRGMLGLVGASFAARLALGAAPPVIRLARFSAEVTVPIGHALMGGGIAPAKNVVDPLFAQGIVLLGGALPIVLVTVDWCEIRNDAYFRWREGGGHDDRSCPRYEHPPALHGLHPYP